MIVLPGDEKTPAAPVSTPLDDEFAAKGAALRAAEEDAYLIRLDGRLTAERVRLMETPPVDRSDIAGPDDDVVTKTLRGFDDFVGARLGALRDPALRERAEAVVARNRTPFETRLKAADHNRRAFALPGQLDTALADFRSGAASDPDAAEAFREKGLMAIRSAAGVLGLSEDSRRARETAFTQGLFTGAMRGQIARGEPWVVKHTLSGPEFDSVFSPEMKATLQREAEVRIARDAVELEDDLDDVFGDAGVVTTELTARAATLLDPDAFKDFQAREEHARAVGDFIAQHRFAPPAEVAAPLDALRPEAGDEDFEAREAVYRSAVAAVRRMTAERVRDPAAYAMRDPDIARVFEDGAPTPRAIARRIRAQREMGVAADKARALTKLEAQSTVAELHALAPAERAARLLSLQDAYGKHYAQALSELIGEGLDRPTQALAAVAGNAALVQAVTQILEAGPKAFREGLSTTDIAKVKTQVATILDDLRAGVEVGGGGPDAAVQEFIAESLALLELQQTGDIFASVKRATNQLVEALNLVSYDALFRMMAAGGLLNNWPVATGNLLDFLNGVPYPNGMRIDPIWLRKFKKVQEQIIEHHQAIERKIKIGRLADGRSVADLADGEEAAFEFCHKGVIEPNPSTELYFASNLGNFQTCLKGKLNARTSYLR